MKTCNLCGESKPLTTEYWHRHKKFKDGFRSQCKDCVKIYRDANKKRDSEQKKIYYKNNKEIILKRQAAAYKKDPEKILQRGRRWHKKNKESVTVRKDRYYKQHKDVYRARTRKRRAQRLGNGYEPYTEIQVLEKYGTDCYLCNIPIDLNAPRWTGLPGWEKGLHIEHVIAIDNGGPDTLANVRPAHGLCNIQKSNKEIYEKN